jgi:hypothetical protein
MVLLYSIHTQPITIITKDVIVVWYQWRLVCLWLAWCVCDLQWLVRTPFWWCFQAMALLETLFWELVENIRSIDRATTTHVHCCLLQVIAFGEPLCVLGILFGGLCVVESDCSTWQGFYFFCILVVGTFNISLDILLVQRLGIIDIFVN